MITSNLWRRTAAVAVAGAALTMAACNTPPASPASEQQPALRTGTVESIQTRTVQSVPAAAGAAGGAVAGGALGSLVGSGTGRTVATTAGAVGGGLVGNELANKTQSTVWDVGVRYDDGSYTTVQQASAPALRVGDRVRVTSTGIELLR
jgi:outer membrane lipoprotein SlyB